jgi:hypothetical protein
VKKRRKKLSEGRKREEKREERGPKVKNNCKGKVENPRKTTVKTLANLSFLSHKIKS